MAGRARRRRPLPDRVDDARDAGAQRDGAYRLANDDEPSTRAGTGLLNGGVPCYDVYRTKDDRFVAVGALEAKFWRILCDALGRPEWAARHWSLGQAIGDADAARLSQEMADLFRTRTRDEWTALLEPLDCCVAPVLTLAEAAVHPLFLPRG